MSSIQVAGPPWNGVSISGCRTCQISVQHSLTGLPERPGMLRPEDRAVGIVVDREVVRSPPEQQGEAIGQQEARPSSAARETRLPTAPRALLDQSNATDALAHLAAAGQKAAALLPQGRMRREIVVHVRPPLEGSKPPKANTSRTHSFPLACRRLPRAPRMADWAPIAASGRQGWATAMRQKLQLELAARRPGLVNGRPLAVCAGLERPRHPSRCASERAQRTWRHG